MQVLSIPRSSIGKKAIMAVTGVVWVGYLALHMWGNLHIFQGPEAFNHYAEFLRTVGEPVFSYAQVLWIIRIVIVVALPPTCGRRGRSIGRHSVPTGAAMPSNGWCRPTMPRASCASAAW